MISVNPGVPVPRRQTVGSAGYDFSMPCDMTFKPGEWVTFDTGIRLEDRDSVRTKVAGTSFNGREGIIPKYIFPDYWFMMLVPRSGLGSDYGFRFSNTAGIIDMDYRGTIKAKCTVDTELTLKKGDRFAQGIIIPYGVFVDEIPPTVERNGGIGSTGV